jgi:hypothetical protein
MKVLSYRLHLMLDKLIDLNQHVFLKDHNIMDNIIIAHEILYFVHRSKQPSILIKLNFEKAFDNVN